MLHMKITVTENPRLALLNAFQVEGLRAAKVTCIDDKTSVSKAYIKSIIGI